MTYFTGKPRGVRAVAGGWHSLFSFSWPFPGILAPNVLVFSNANSAGTVTGERIRDKIAASKRKGMWMGGMTPVGYLSRDRTLEIDEPQAQRIREIYRLYLELDCVRRLQGELQRRGWGD